MRTIRATCPLCQDEVELAPTEILLQVVDIDEKQAGAMSRYGFQCPNCEVFVIKPAAQSAVELLVEGGVELSVDPLPDGLLGHPELPVNGPAFTANDLIDFHQLLATDDWFGTLEALVRSER